MRPTQRRIYLRKLRCHLRSICAPFTLIALFALILLPSASRAQILLGERNIEIDLTGTGSGGANLFPSGTASDLAHFPNGNPHSGLWRGFNNGAIANSTDASLVDWVADGLPNTDTPTDPATTLVTVGINLTAGHQTGAIAPNDVARGHWHGTRIVDGVAGTDQNIFLTGGKEQDLSSWNPGPGTVGSAKYDITQVYLATSISADGKSIAYFGMERRGNNGSTAFDFEFNKNAPDPDDVRNHVGGTLSGAFRPVIPKRSEGDLLISYEVKGSGSSGSATAHFFTYSESDGLYHPETPSVLPYTEINQVPTPAAPWGFVNEKGLWTTGMIDRFEFAEGKVDLSAIPGFTPQCGALYHVQVRTRASVSDTADMKDLTRIFGFVLVGTSADAGPDQTVCASSTSGIQLAGSVGGTATGGTWDTAGTGTFDNKAKLDAVYTPSQADIANGSVILTLTTNDPNGPCGASSDTMLITFIGLTCSIDPAGVTPVKCYGESNGSATVTVTGGTGPYTYSWDDAETSAKATKLKAGRHTVTVTDSQGCTTSCEVTITQPDLLTCTAVQDSAVKCHGDSNGTATVTVTGGNGGNTYAWDDGETTATATKLTAGTHKVTITDSLGCTTFCEVTITQPDLLTCSAVQDSAVKCNGEGNGSATVTPVGGNGGYTYAWDNGETTTTATNLNVGSHTVTVTDSKGCTTTCTVTITQPEPLTCTATQNSPVKCFGEGNGSATVAPVGGNGGYSYAWDNGETTQTATNLNAGTHAVTVTDSKGCTTSCEVTITQPDLLTCTAVQDSAVKCHGESNGSATVTATGGNGSSYTYAWDNGETTATATKLSAGEHTVTVTDAKGCTTSCVVMITQPDALSCSAVQDSPVRCNGESNGRATVTPIGGNGGYTYQWDNGETSATAEKLNAGLHTVTVKDSLGCTTVCNVTITEPAKLVVDIRFEPILCNGADSMVTITATGGTEPYTGTGTFPVKAGTHTFVVTDANGCSETQTIEIPEPSKVTFTVEKTDASCSQNDGVIKITASGGVGGYKYALNGSYQDSNVFSGLVAGTYEVRVRDANGCEADPQTVMIVAPPAPTPATLTKAALDNTALGPYAQVTGTFPSNPRVTSVKWEVADHSDSNGNPYSPLNWQIMSEPSIDDFASGVSKMNLYLDTMRKYDPTPVVETGVRVQGILYTRWTWSVDVRLTTYVDRCEATSSTVTVVYQVLVDPTGHGKKSVK